MAGRKVGCWISLIFTLCFHALFAQSPNCSLASQFYSQDSITITTFGASTVQGVGGAGFQGYLAKDIQYCYSGKIVTIYNYGVAGETTGLGLKRIDEAIKGKTGFIFILMGVNDAVRIADNRQKLSETQANMRLMIEKCLAAKLVVILGTLQTINEQGSALYRRANVAINQINTIYRNLALEYKIALADINRAFGRNFRLYSDQIHPNNRGYAFLALVWFDALNKTIEANFLKLYISQNFPNPAITTTSMIYTVPEAGKVEIALYNLNGQFVKYLVDEYENTGVYTKPFDVTDLENGIYIYVFTTSSKRISKKMIVAR